MKAKLLIVFGIIVSMALAGVWASPGGVAEATTFNPDQVSVSFSTTALNGNPDIVTTFTVNDPSSNFSAQAGDNVTFTDPAVSIADAAAIPNEGAYMGQLTSLAQLGIGILMGIPVAAWLLSEFESVGRIPTDSPFVLAFVLGACVMVLIGMLACTAPALRALRIMPTEALRDGG